MRRERSRSLALLVAMSISTMTILLILVVHRALRLQPFGAMHAGRISVVGSRSLSSSDQLGPLP